VERESYISPFQLGKPLEGGCVGRVLKSRNAEFHEGDHVLSMYGWREYYISDGSGLSKIDSTLAPMQAYLGIMGMPGMTAYIGLLEMAKPGKKETVFVSAAAGAVGSAVCQIAKIKGCRVIGSAGSEEKTAWLLEEAGIDEAINYKKSKNLMIDLGDLCPNRIDIYYDNVGGEHLEAALEHMRECGRIVLCGMISQYNATKRPRGPSNLFRAIERRLTLRGFIVTDHFDRIADFQMNMGQWIKEGKIKWKETIVDGIEQAPGAFIGLFKGENFGKMIVKIGPDPGSQDK
jgi:NADPH-dependent curcumin reductase CurA